MPQLGFKLFVDLSLSFPLSSKSVEQKSPNSVVFLVVITLIPSVMDWIVSPQKSVETLTPNVTEFRDRAFERNEWD